MSNLELKPVELVCEDHDGRSVSVEVLGPRDVPLGGPRAMSVRRTLPQRARSLIGAWCFVDHFGPDRVADTGGMVVPPHPHTGLQTVSWLFTGEVEHRDSAGFHAIVRPGELNLMSAGAGISHSEVSTPDTEVLHGVQLWVALPSATRFSERDFIHYVPDPVSGEGFVARVFLGSLAGSTSPVPTYSPLVGAELSLQPGADVPLVIDSSFEHGFLVDTGSITVNGEPVLSGELAFVAAGAATVSIGSTDGARILVLGGPPFGESIVMWWNFVGRSHEEIVDFREQWQAEIDTSHQARETDMFGLAADDPREPLPAPTLPNARIKPRS